MHEISFMIPMRDLKMLPIFSILDLLINKLHHNFIVNG